MEQLLSSFKCELDAIITDPLYDRGSIPTYGELARLAATALRPGGVLAVMCGQSYLPEILQLMTRHLPYRWMMSVLTPDAHAHLHQRKVYANWKPVVVLGDPRGWIRGDVIKGADSGRVLHKFQQSEDVTVQLIEKLTEKNWLVCDPFVGSGTTAIACLRTGRRFVGCDVDEAAVRMARKQVADLNIDAA